MTEIVEIIVRQRSVSSKVNSFIGLPLGGLPGQILAKTTTNPYDVEWVDPEFSDTAGLPSGGDTGQVLAKSSDTDYETEWVNPGTGPAGADGSSAYEVALSQGFVGTEQEWLNSLIGPPGADGDDGGQGLSAYQVALSQGFVGTEQEWLDSLIGPEGPEGPTIPATTETAGVVEQATTTEAENATPGKFPDAAGVKAFVDKLFTQLVTLAGADPIVRLLIQRTDGATANDQHAVELRNANGGSRILFTNDTTGKTWRFATEASSNDFGITLQNSGAFEFRLRENGVLKLGRNGAGVELTSPDGLTTKVLGIDNTGALEVRDP